MPEQEIHCDAKAITRSDSSNCAQVLREAAYGQLGNFPQLSKNAAQLSKGTQDSLLTEHLLSSQLHKPEQNDPSVADLLREGAYSALYMTTQAPVKALAQVADRVLTATLIKTNLEKSLDVLPAPEPADSGTARWHAQHIGEATGMVLPFLATRGSLKMAGLSFAARTEATVASSGLMASIADGALTGAANGFFLTPVAPGEGKFWETKTNNTLTTAAAFSALTAGSMAVRQIGGSMARELVGGKRILWDVTTGMASGVPATVADSNVNSILKTGRLASWDEPLKGDYTMLVVAGIMNSFRRVPRLDTRFGQ